jgi:ParB family transcriptional regulator, chromosome partitioning protein
LNVPPKRRLGRGLAALIGDDEPVVDLMPASTGMRYMPIDAITPNRANPRKSFDEDELETLARSIRAKGLIQPLIVRETEPGLFEIVAGERRWRAAQRAHLHDVPVVVRDFDERETLEIALIENIQRADLNPLEEAMGYKQLLDQYGYTQQQLADGLGKSRSHIANTLRLLHLPDKVKDSIIAGLLTAGHARTLVATENPGEIAQKIIALGLSVREAEDLVRKTGTTSAASADKVASKDADTRDIERHLTQSLGLKVAIAHKGARGGVVSISYKSLDQFDALVRSLTQR